jgi:hypothetical protein
VLEKMRDTGLMSTRDGEIIPCDERLALIDLQLIRFAYWSVHMTSDSHLLEWDN